MNTRSWLAALLLASFLAGAPAGAADDTRTPAAPASEDGLRLAPVPWNSLTADQQKFLERARPQWDTLPPPRQHRLLRGAQRWAGMSEQQRAEARVRLERWKALPPERKQELRGRAQRFRNLPLEQRMRLRDLAADLTARPKTLSAAIRPCRLAGPANGTWVGSPETKSLTSMASPTA
jgi:hypothetical protein